MVCLVESVFMRDSSAGVVAGRLNGAVPQRPALCLVRCPGMVDRLTRSVEHAWASINLNAIPFPPFPLRRALVFPVLMMPPVDYFFRYTRVKL